MGKSAGKLTLPYGNGVILVSIFRGPYTVSSSGPPQLSFPFIRLHVLSADGNVAGVLACQSPTSATSLLNIRAHSFGRFGKGN